MGQLAQGFQLAVRREIFSANVHRPRQIFPRIPVPAPRQRHGIGLHGRVIPDLLQPRKIGLQPLDARCGRVMPDPVAEGNVMGGKEERQNRLRIKN